MSADRREDESARMPAEANVGGVEAEHTMCEAGTLRLPWWLSRILCKGGGFFYFISDFFYFRINYARDCSGGGAVLERPKEAAE
jgi:hypothetical protein